MTREELEGKKICCSDGRELYFCTPAGDAGKALLEIDQILVYVSVGGSEPALSRTTLQDASMTCLAAQLLGTVLGLEVS